MSSAMIRRPARGYLRDSFDERDKAFRLVRPLMADMKVSATEEYDIPEFTPISDQLTLGSCVANAWCDALEILRGIEDPNNVTQLARLFLYWTTRSATGDQKRDSGTSLRMGAKQLAAIGIVDEARWPYDVSKVFTSPTLECFNVASDNQISAYYRIDDIGLTMIDDIETAIRANHPVVFGIQVGDTFDNYDGVTPIGVPSTIRGGHAIIATGFRKYADGRRDIKIRNSWSDQWGNAGHAWLRQEYMMTATDLWVGTRMKELVL